MQHNVYEALDKYMAGKPVHSVTVTKVARAGRPTYYQLLGTCGHNRLTWHVLKEPRMVDLFGLRWEDVKPHRPWINGQRANYHARQPLGGQERTPLL